MKTCFYCDKPPGLEGLKPYEAGGVVEHLHPSCMQDMLEHGSHGDDDDQVFEPVALSPGGDA
jgi:hypothetical protein